MPENEKWRTFKFDIEKAFDKVGPTCSKFLRICDFVTDGLDGMVDKILHNLVNFVNKG